MAKVAFEISSSRTRVQAAGHSNRATLLYIKLSWACDPRSYPALYEIMYMAGRGRDLYKALHNPSPLHFSAAQHLLARIEQRNYATEDNAQSFVMENSVESLKGGG